LVEVDLRSGIAEEQSTRKETLKLCLNEIRFNLKRPSSIRSIKRHKGTSKE